MRDKKSYMYSEQKIAGIKTTLGPPTGVAHFTPDTIRQGDSNVSITFYLNEGMAPLTEVLPAFVRIGETEGRDITREGDCVTAVFDISENEPVGHASVIVAFPTPDGSMNYMFKGRGIGVQPAERDLIVYVNAGNTKGPWDGRSWNTAYKDIQTGLNFVYEKGGGAVWVNKGIYTPDSGKGRSASIQLRPGIALYGGFKGGETSLDQRDWA